ncbi:MAG: hormogonium polysaccharide biosynthesis glycosyltransferase HpsE [Xenococcaceae cyanobacterium]
MDFTVAIPTYNGADRLPTVLEHLKCQIDTEGISWEILVVDNNSNDHTAEVVQKHQVNWSSSAILRYCFEPKQGLTYARQCAVEQAQGLYVGFLDDDNFPASNWVIAAYSFGQNNRLVGAFGGKIQGKFENDIPPESLSQVANYLAIRQYGSIPKRFDPKTLQLPAGAGLVIRKEAWLRCVPPPTRGINCRGGDDYSISLHLHKHGWQIWYNPEMEIEHYIPANRIEKKYLSGIAYCYGLVTCEMLAILTPPHQRIFIFLKSFLGSSKRIILHLLKWKLKLRTDLGAAVELSFHWGNLISPIAYCIVIFKRS